MLDDLCLVFWCPFGRPGELIQLNPPDPEDKPVVYRIRDIRIERLFSISGPDIIHSGCPQSELNGGRPKYLAWFRRQWEEAWGEDSWADDLIWIAELGSPKKLEKRG